MWSYHTRWDENLQDSEDTQLQNEIAPFSPRHAPFQNIYAKIFQNPNPGYQVTFHRVQHLHHNSANVLFICGGRKPGPIVQNWVKWEYHTLHCTEGFLIKRAEIVLLIQSSKLAFNRCFHLQCFQHLVKLMTLDAPTRVQWNYRSAVPCSLQVTSDVKSDLRFEIPSIKYFCNHAFYLRQLSCNAGLVVVRFIFI